MKELCNVEMVSRSCKTIFNDKIRKAIVHFGDVKAQKVEEEMKSYTLQLFLTVLGSQEQSRKVLVQILKDEILILLSEEILGRKVEAYYQREVSV